MAEDVSKPHALYNEMEEKRRLCRTLMGGTEAMRDARTEYLPQEPAEEDDAYQNRLDRSFLFNAFKRTVSSLVGQVFDREVIVEGPTRLTDEWQYNVTNEGRTLTAFGKDVFETALAEGLSIIQVEYPRSPGQMRLDQERASGLRPYLIEVPPQNLIWWDWQVVAGRPILTEARIRESYFDDGGKRQDQIRVLRPGEWELWRANEARDWSLTESGNTAPIREIPLVPLYAGKKLGVMMADLPLKDLADMNVEHWQSSSDQRHVLHVARVPILFAAGWGEELNTVTLGPNVLLKASAAGATLQFVEHTGSAIGAGREDLQDIEDRMATVGLEMLMRDRPGGVTATERAIERAENESALEGMARNVESALEDALSIMCKWAGLTEDVSCDVNRQFEMKISDAQELSDLRDLRLAGDLSRETLWYEYRRRGVLSDSFDPEEEAGRIDTEGPPTGGAATGGMFGAE